MHMHKNTQLYAPANRNECLHVHPCMHFHANINSYTPTCQQACMLTGTPAKRHVCLHVFCYYACMVTCTPASKHVSWHHLPTGIHAKMLNLLTDRHASMYMLMCIHLFICLPANRHTRLQSHLVTS
jgi:hypothetical protein